MNFSSIISACRRFRRRIEELADEAPRWLVLVTVFAAFLLLYLPIGWWPTQEPLIVPLTAIDRAMPQWSWTVVVYLSLYPFAAVALWLLPVPAFGRALFALSALMLLHFAVYLACPTVYPRSGEASGLMALVWAMDRPTNACPSIHVFVAVFLTLALLREEKRRWLALPLAVWAVAVVISTLTTKQHALVDVLAGSLMALLAFWLFHGAMAPGRSDST